MRKLLPIQPEVRHIVQALSWYRFSSGLTGVFIPLLILRSGGSLFMIAAFYLLFAIIKLVADFPAIVMIQRRGVHFGLGASFVCYAIELASILGYTRTHGLIFLIIGSVSLGLIDSFGDNARHIYVSAATEKSGKSSSIAIIEIFGQIADFTGPIGGALIGTLFGADWLLASGLLCLAFTIRPLASIGKLSILDQSTKLHFTLRNAPWRDVVADACFGSEETVSRILWPIFLAVILGTFSQIGVVTAISTLGTVVAIWVAGRRGDRGQNRSVLLQGVAGMSIVNWLRLAATSFWPITLLGLGYRTTQGYGLNALNATYYSHAQDRGLPYIISIEIASDIGYLVTWSILFAILAISKSSSVLFASGFIIAAITIWGALLYTPYQHRALQTE
jgi:hypothetical protein